MRTAQINMATGEVFAIVSPPVQTPAPDGVHYIHFDAKDRPEIVCGAFLEAAWGQPTKDGVDNATL